MEKRPAKNQLAENGEELEKMSLTWGEGQAKPQDKDKWRRIIFPFCTVPERMKKLSEWVSYCAQRLTEEEALHLPWIPLYYHARLASSLLSRTYVLLSLSL